MISDNGTYGVLIANANTNSNTLTSNKIGTDVTGTYALPNLDGRRDHDGAELQLVGVVRRAITRAAT